MLRFALPIAVAAMLAAAPLVYADSDTDLTGPGFMSRQQVATSLTGAGYAVQKVESDDGAYKAKVTKGGQKLKLMVDPRTGAVTSSKVDD